MTAIQEFDQFDQSMGTPIAMALRQGSDPQAQAMPQNAYPMQLQQFAQPVMSGMAGVPAQSGMMMANTMQPAVAPTPQVDTTAPCDDIRTLFVAGLPYDATDRELYLLFGGTEGYGRSMVVRKEGGKRPYAFVNYEAHYQAEAAKKQLDGFKWDPSESLRLKCELSKKNTPDWFTTSCASPSSIRKRLDALPKNPKTVYLTGIPDTVSKELFDAFVVTNFSGQVGGMRYTLPTEKKTSFAFVGFMSHELAKAAMERLEGYVWAHESATSTLHATFANTEWNPQSARN